MLTTIIAVELIMLDYFKRLKYRNDIQMKITKYIYKVSKQHIILYSLNNNSGIFWIKKPPPSAHKIYSIQWHRN